MAISTRAEGTQHALVAWVIEHGCRVSQLALTLCLVFAAVWICPFGRPSALRPAEPVHIFMLVFAGFAYPGLCWVFMTEALRGDRDVADSSIRFAAKAFGVSLLLQVATLIDDRSYHWILDDPEHYLPLVAGLVAAWVVARRTA